MNLLGPKQIREIAAELDVRPTKMWGQNFVHDPGTVRKIVRSAGVVAGQHVVEVGPGLGSLTLGLLEQGCSVVAVEIDPRLAARLGQTVSEFAPSKTDDLTVINQDALKVFQLPDPQPTAMVANLPYNISVPLIISFLERFASIETVLVMVQAEVAERLVAKPGSKIYGVPSVKAAWFTEGQKVADIGTQVFWPVPRVASALVQLKRHQGKEASVKREAVFQIVDLAFAQRRKTLRAAFGKQLGPGIEIDQVFMQAGIDPMVRGEQLQIDDFIRIAEAVEAQRKDK